MLMNANVADCSGDAGRPIRVACYVESTWIAQNVDCVLRIITEVDSGRCGREAKVPSRFIQKQGVVNDRVGRRDTGEVVSQQAIGEDGRSADRDCARGVLEDAVRNRQHRAASTLKEERIGAGRVEVLGNARQLDKQRCARDRGKHSCCVVAVNQRTKNARVAAISCVDRVGNARALTGGDETVLTSAINWYLNPNVRLMFEYSNILETDGSNTLRDVAEGLGIFQFRSQYTF